MVRIWDFYPTFLEVAGATYTVQSGKKDLMGKSFLPLLKGESFDDEKYFVSAFEKRSRGILKDNWKLVNYFDGPYELYDLDNDPTETNNLAENHPELVNQLAAEWINYTQIHGFENNGIWNASIGDKIRGWGYDFMRDGLVSAVPEFMSADVALNTKLTLNFSGRITFAGTDGKRIRLQKYGVPGEIWSADPTTSSQYEGHTSITFDNFPKLDPNAHYNITWDDGWVKYEKNGVMTNIQSIKESAYAYRFKTIESSGTSVNSNKVEMDMKIYQNIKGKTLEVHTPFIYPNSLLEVYNTSGTKLVQTKLNEQNLSMYIGGWRKAIYIAKIIADEGFISQKFVIQ